MLDKIQEFVKQCGYDFVVDINEDKVALKTDKYKIVYWVNRVKTKTGEVLRLTIYNVRTGETNYETFQTSNDPLTQSELKKLEKVQKEQAEKLEKEKLAENKRVQEFALSQWAGAGGLKSHPYLVRKGFTALEPSHLHTKIKLRTSEVFSGETELLCGVFDTDNVLWQYQTIRSDGSKTFLEGGRVSGCFLNVSAVDIADGNVIYICEGVATALSIALAFDWKVPVLSAFNAGNLLAVGEAIREKYPKLPILFCADNDCWKQDTGNTGVRAGEECVSRIDGAALAVPDFSGCSTSTHPTDYNDLHCLQGTSEVKRQIEAVKTNRPEFIYPLGHQSKTYFFTTLRNPAVQPNTEFSTVDCLKLASINYWKKHYPALRGGVDWDMVKSDLIKKCIDKGPFETKRILGRGAALVDQNRVVQNCGDRLWCEGRYWEMQDFKSDFFFDPGPAIFLPDPAKLQTTDIDQAERLIGDLSFENPLDIKLFLGWMFLAPIAGALDWRPHLMITAAAGTGKSTVLNYIVEPTFRFLHPIKDGDSTEAGLRQSLRADSSIVILDEFDTNKKDTKKLDNLINLLRLASDGQTLKRGTPSGKTMQFTARFIGLLSGVNPPKLEEADRTRIHEIIMSKNYKRSSWREFEKELLDFWPDVGPKLFWTSLERVVALKESVRVLHTAISPHLGSRSGQQLGTLLAGYWHWRNDAPVGSKEAVELIEPFVSAEKTGQKHYSDSDDCKEWLANLLLVHGQNKKTSLGEFLELGESLEYKNEVLLNYGMGIVDGKLFVPSNHPELMRHFSNTVWKDWTKTLRRCVGSKAGTMKRGGLFRRGVILTMDVGDSGF